MRTDTTIDKVQVRCPNARTGGFSKGKAQVGDILLYREGDCACTRMARMIGRVHYAPALDGDKAPIRDYILVIALGDMLDHSYERWINPDDVLVVESPQDQKRVLEYFLSDQIVKAPIDEVRKCAGDGWSTLDAYRTWEGKKAADYADWLTRHPERATI